MIYISCLCPYHVPHATSLPWTVVGKLLCELNLLGSWSRLLFTCAPQWFPFGGSHLACAGQMAWLGATDQTWSWTWPSAFFNPAWTSWSGPSLLPHTLCSWWLQCLCSVHFPQEGTSLSVGLSARGGLPDQPSCTHHCVCVSLNIASFPVWFLAVFMHWAILMNCPALLRVLNIDRFAL